MNILILSPGRRVELVEYFREIWNPHGAHVHTLDITPWSAALTKGDRAWVVPKQYADCQDYVGRVLEICVREHIRGALSLIDPELVLLGRNRAAFESVGVTLVQSDLQFIENTLDKFVFFREYHAALPLLPTWTGHNVIAALANGDITFPLFAKMRTGSGSIGSHCVRNHIALRAMDDLNEFVFQPCIAMQEFGADLYFDLTSGTLLELVIKKKVAMRAGETDKAVTVHDAEIECILARLGTFGGIRGPVDVDVFRDHQGKVWINEINPRFGGGYPLAHRAGANFPQWVWRNLSGEVSREARSTNYESGLVLMKYNGLHFSREDELPC